MEIVQLGVQRSGTASVGLQAKLIDLDSGTCRLAVVWPLGGEERHFDASDYYECLRAFRRVVEPEGFRVLCQGARPNVRPSGMSVQAGALLSYAHSLGEPALTKNLVRTFDPVEDVALVSTVAEQDEWMARHREALSKKRGG